MPFSIVQAGTGLKKLSTAGVATTLTLPAGVTLSAARRPRFAVLGRTVYIVNSPSVNIAVDPDFTVRVMCPLPPTFPGRLEAGSATGLTGVYRFWLSNKIVSAEDGNLLAESPLSPVSNSVTLANQSLKATFVGISPQGSVNARGVYRSLVGGTVPFHLFDLDDNTVQTWEDGLADAGLSLLAQGGELGCPPGSSPGTRMELICAWKDRLWGKSAEITAVDILAYSGNRKGWAWPSENELVIPPAGQDAEGITAFIPRRDELGVARRNAVYKIQTSGAGFSITQVVNGKGLIAPDSVAVINDVGYGLGVDGVYTLSASGFQSITDETVRPWFTTDTYFNRSRFAQAFGGYNPVTNSYDLHLAAAGSNVEDRWISYSLDNKVWLGPHKTGAFTPTCRILGRDSNNTDTPYIGASDGKVYGMNSATRTDGTNTAIDFDLRTIHSCNTPSIEKQFLQADVLAKVEAAGLLSITPTVGGLDASAQAAQTVDLTLGRQRTQRLGRGRFLQLKWQQATNAQDVTLFGAEIPFFEIGRR